MDGEPTPEKIAYFRGRILERCLRYRRGLRNKTFLKKYRAAGRAFLRMEQVGLLKLRIWRSTGTYPRDDN